MQLCHCLCCLLTYLWSFAVLTRRHMTEYQQGPCKQPINVLLSFMFLALDEDFPAFPAVATTTAFFLGVAGSYACKEYNLR